MEEVQKEPNIGATEALGEHASNPPTLRTSGDVVVTSWGAEYTLAGDEMRLKAQFEQWVRRNARRAIQEAEVADGPEEAAAMRSAYAADYGAGHYNWDGRHIRSARGDLPGLRYWLFLLLRRCHPDMTEELATSIFKDSPKGCGQAFAWVAGNWGSPGQKQAETAGGNGTGWVKVYSTMGGVGSYPKNVPLGPGMMLLEEAIRQGLVETSLRGRTVRTPPTPPTLDEP